MTDATAPAKLPGGVTGKGFKPGADARRYRGGGKARAGYEELRREIRALCDEPARDKAGQPILRPDGKPMSQREAMIRRCMTTPRYALQVLEIAYGPFPKQVEVTGEEGGAILIRVDK